MPAYASEKDRYLAHLVYAVANISNGLMVTDSAARIAYAMDRLEAMGVDSIAMGAAIIEGLPHYASGSE